MKIKILTILCLAFLLMGFGSKAPTPSEGVSAVKLRSFTFFDLMDLVSEKVIYRSNIVELVDSKPDGLEVEPDLSKVNQYKFGIFKVGNNEQKVWFLLIRDAQNIWSEVYVDQNCDNRIILAEKIRGFQNYEGKYKSYHTNNSFSMIPAPIRVSYKGANSEIQKKLYFFISISTYSNKGDSDTMVEVLSASFLDGEMKVLSGKEFKLVKFRILDANGNGCFNDFGTDLLFIDSNNDGYFKKKEGFVLKEFIDYVGPDKVKKQLRVIIPPLPGKVAIVEAMQEFDSAQLEAVSDPKDEEAAPANENNQAPSSGDAKK